MFISLKQGFLIRRMDMVISVLFGRKVVLVKDQRNNDALPKAYIYCCATDARQDINDGKVNWSKLNESQQNEALKNSIELYGTN